MIAFIKVSQLIAISLLCLVSCSSEFSHKNKSNSTNTGGAESDVLGCWQISRFTSYANGSYFSSEETLELESDGSYTRNNTIGANFSSPRSRTFSGKWTIDDRYVVLQDQNGYKLTYKVISKYELIQVGDSSGFAYKRC